MLKKFIDDVKKLDDSILKLIKKGISFAFIVCIIASIFLSFYIFFYSKTYIFLMGFNLFKTGIIIMLEFIIVGIIFDKVYIKNSNN